MGYKTVLTIVADSDLSHSALDAAIEVARREDAHLDILCLGVDRTQTGYYYAGTSAMILQETLAQAQKEAAEAESAVNERMAAEGAKWSCESAVAQLAGVSYIVAQRARFADLVVLPKPYGPKRGIEDEAAVEAAMFSGQAPVLIAPGEVVVPKRIMIAWNESNEALSAVRAALPLLTKADVVNVAIIAPPEHGPDRSDPGGMLSQMLARHGVHVEVSILSKTMPRVSDVLNRHAQDISADMMVMGAYGHSRVREAILGGATRNMLENAEIPVFMAH